MMTLHEFNNLSKRYLDGLTTEQEDEFLLEWMNNQNFSEDTNTNLPEEKILLAKKRMWEGIENHREYKGGIRRLKITLYSGIAASIFLLATYFLTIDKQLVNSNLSKSTQKGIVVKNTSDSSEVVLLADGTQVFLTKNSSLSYDRNFNKIRREVYLKGNAFFKVKRDEQKLFIVHSGSLSAEVLGTSFWVKTNSKSKSVEVEVATGKVSVYTHKTSHKNEKKGVILTPNQKVIFDEASQNINQSLSERPKPLIQLDKTPEKFIFKNLALADALSQFSEVYGIEFVISNQLLNNCRITADLSNLGMYNQLELLCQSIDATYEKRGTVIFVNGDGC